MAAFTDGPRARSQELKPFQELLNCTKVSLHRIADLMISQSRFLETW